MAPPAWVIAMKFEDGKRSLSVAILLTLSGGFLDAFAYVGHGHVFANTMTGNVALLGMNIAALDWIQASRHLPPLVAFICAVFVVHLLGLEPGRRWVRHPAVACLVLEIIFLVVAASRVIRIDDFWLIPGISFVATLQTLSFTHVEDVAYTSVMTTGNLRRATQNLLAGLIPRHDVVSLHDAWLLGLISLSFLTGAVLGGYMTAHMHDSALWVVTALLAVALFGIFRKALGRAPDDTGCGSVGCQHEGHADHATQRHVFQPLCCGDTGLPSNHE
ncbi:uncharacterized membrane protein YoaK (UPF0700 family) [Rhodanobacter sp. MP7CTX1]|nr:uncharacterized membrane protein YoaK (UPF0700 family) [Rhodanobacter sp. MP7CTX1]